MKSTAISVGTALGVAASCALLLSGCAAQLSFIDRVDGSKYAGRTGSTAGGAGAAQAEIAGRSYTGEWIFQRSGGSMMLGSMGTSSFGSGTVQSGTNSAFLYGFGSTTGSMSALAVPTSGQGMLHLRAVEGGSHVRCIFTFNAMGNTGIGECRREDGREFDLLIKR